MLYTRPILLFSGNAIFSPHSPENCNLVQCNLDFFMSVQHMLLWHGAFLSLDYYPTNILVSSFPLVRCAAFVGIGIAGFNIYTVCRSLHGRFYGSHEMKNFSPWAYPMVQTTLYIYYKSLFDTISTKTQKSLISNI